MKRILRISAWGGLLALGTLIAAPTLFLAHATDPTIEEIGVHRIQNGGTGATNAADARANLGVTGAGTGTVTSAALSVPGSSILGVTGSPVTTSGTLGLTTTGTSGGVPYFSSSSVLSSSGALTANLPLIGGGAGTAPTVGTRSGNTTAYVTTTGTQTSGDCVKIDASGNHIANGSACGSGGAVSVTAGTPDLVVTPSPGTGTFTVGSTNAQNSPADGGSHSYTVLSSDITKELTLVSTFTGLAVPQATGSFAAGASFGAVNAGAVTATSTTSTINGIAGATGIKLGANQFSQWDALGGNWLVGLGLPQPATQTGSTILKDDMTWAAITAAQVPVVPTATGTTHTMTAPREYWACTGTCTVTMPVPAAGYEFCVFNDDNVSTAITLAALGSSAMYESSARTSYGTAGTGTLVVSAAAANKVCVVGRDSTHYWTVSYNGTVTVN